MSTVHHIHQPAPDLLGQADLPSDVPTPRYDPRLLMSKAVSGEVSALTLRLNSSSPSSVCAKVQFVVTHAHHLYMLISGKCCCVC